MSRVIAVTGTDTGVGKTRIASALLLALRATGAQVAGYKPVASGSDATAEGLRNEDALALQAASSPGLRYDEVNPVTFAPAIAPHIAAQREGRPIPLATLDQGLEALRARHAWVVVEGAGGWRVPLTDRVDFADWVTGHRLPTLLVVGIRLGAINHSLLTAEALKAAGLWLGPIGIAITLFVASVQAVLATKIWPDLVTAHPEGEPLDDDEPAPGSQTVEFGPFLALVVVEVVWLSGLWRPLS